MKVFDRGRVVVVLGWFPGGLHIAGPFDVVFEAVTGYFGVEDFLNYLFGDVVDCDRWGWGDWLAGYGVIGGRV